MRISPRTLLRLILAPAMLVLLAGVPVAKETARASDESVVLQMKWLPQAQFAGYFVALEKGFYRRAGLANVRLVNMPVQNSAMEPLLSGEADFCVEWLPNALIQRDRGREVVCLIQLFQKSSLVFLVHRSAWGESPADLRDRPVQVWMNEAGVMPRLFLRSHGVEPKLIPLGSSLSPFLRKAVVAISATRYNEYHKVIEGGVRPEEIVSVIPAEHGFDYPEDGLYCMGSTAREKPALCRAIVRASLEGWAYALDPKNERETVEIIMRKAGEARHITNENHQTHMLRQIREYVVHRVGENPRNWGTLSEQDYRKTVELLEKSEMIRNAVPYEEFHVPENGGKNAK